MSIKNQFFFFIISIFFSACSEQVVSPDKEIGPSSEDQEDLLFSPKLESITVRNNSIYQYGETVISTKASHPSSVDPNRKIIYEYRYIDLNGNPSLIAYPKPSSSGGNLYYSLLRLRNGDLYPPEERAGVQIRIFFEGVPISDETPIESGIFIQTNVFIQTVSNPANIVGEDKIQYSHHILKIYIPAGGEFFQLRGEKPFVRVTYPSQSWDPSNDPLSIQNVSTRRESTLRMYYFVAHPKGSNGEFYSSAIMSAYAGQTVDSTWTIVYPGGASGDKILNGVVVSKPNRDAPVSENSGEGEVILNETQPPGSFGSPEETSRRYDFIAGTMAAKEVEIKVVFSNGSSSVTKSFKVDVLEEEEYQNRLAKIYPPRDN